MKGGAEFKRRVPSRKLLDDIPNTCLINVEDDLFACAPSSRLNVRT
jgi:hypothetical protein